MSPETKKIVDYHLSSYRRHGAKSYRKRQYRRLLMILNNIFEYEPYARGQLERIGRSQVIGYWRRTEHESSQVRLEKWRILAFLFSRLGKKTPPRPKKFN